MKTLVLSVGLGLALAAGCGPGPVTSASAAPPATLDQKIAAMLPTEAEDRWLQIPWRADLAQARAEAQRAGKPLYMWVMDGNPLGCG